MWPYPRIVAHRGGGKLAPENTLAGFRTGLARGFRAVEFDVMLARDGVPVVMHDPFLGRTVNGSGNVYDYDAAELTRMDAGSWFGADFAQETVPLYTEVLAFCKANGIWMNVELKPAPGYEAETGRVVAGLTRALFGPEIAQDDVRLLPLFSSFQPAALESARAAAPDIPRGLLLKETIPDWEALARSLSASAIHHNHMTLDLPTAAAIKRAGFGLFCYTVNDPARARELLAWGVDGFCTDRLDLIGPDFA